MKQIKLKIVNKGTVATVYQWERIFLCFGYWIPFYSIASNSTENVKRFVEKFDYLGHLQKL